MSFITRSNYFQVKNEDKFKNFMDTIFTRNGIEKDVLVWEKKSDGKTLFSFGTHSQILGIPNETGDIDIYSFDRFISGLKEQVSENDAIIIYTTSNENESLYEGAIVITSQSTDEIDIEDIAMKIAEKRLKKKKVFCI